MLIFVLGEKELEELKESRITNIYPQVKKEELERTILELKLYLMVAQIPAESLLKGLFKGFSVKDSISIFELSRLIKRVSNGKKGDPLKLARFLIEAEANMEYNEFLEEKVDVICQKMAKLLGNYTIYNAEIESELRSSLMKKITLENKQIKNAIKSLEKEEGIIETIALDQIGLALNVELSSSEKEFIMFSMYKVSGDIDALQTEILLKLLEKPEPKIEKETPPAEDNYVEKDDLPENVPEENNKEHVKEEDKSAKQENEVIPESVPQEIEKDNVQELEKEYIQESIHQDNEKDVVQESIPKEEEKDIVQESIPKESEKQNNKEPEKDYEEKFEDEEKKNPFPVSQSEPQEKSSDPLEPKQDNMMKLEGADINEDQMIEIAQKCFSVIAEQMLQKHLTIKTLFKEVIQKVDNDGEEEEFIPAQDFLKVLQGLEIEELQEIEYMCLLKVLAANEEGDIIRVGDILQVMEEYGIQENEAAEKPSQKQKKEENYDELDNISVVLVLALAEYLAKEGITVNELFGNVITKQQVKSKNKEKNVELISSKDFFSILEGIGIKMEENEHDNLKQFLCLDQSNIDQISLKKLIKTVEQFQTNEELRKHAQKCYEDLVNEAENDEEEEGEEPAPE